MFTDHQEIEFQTHDGLKLRAILSGPREARAAVLLLSGGGNVGAQGDVTSPFIGSGYRGMPASLNEQLASALLEKNVLSLRFDKRGFADPSHLPTQTFPNLLEDAIRAHACLRAHAPGVPIYLIGFSEGAWIATYLAKGLNGDGVFLLSPPTRPYSEILRYQFVDWPLRVLKKLDSDRRDYLTRENLLSADMHYLPLGELDAFLGRLGIVLPAANTGQLPYDHAGRISFARLEILYEARFKQISALLEAPLMKPLYGSYLNLPPLTDTARAVSAPVYVYLGLADSQVDPGWILEDAKAFPNLKRVSIFDHYGHCFAPVHGKIGQGKTSGPISKEVIERITADLSELLPRQGSRIQ